MTVALCVYICRDVVQRDAIVAFLRSSGLNAWNDRLLLGEYGIYVAFDDTVDFVYRSGDAVTDAIDHHLGVAA